MRAYPYGPLYPLWPAYASTLARAGSLCHIISSYNMCACIDVPPLSESPNTSDIPRALDGLTRDLPHITQLQPRQPIDDIPNRRQAFPRVAPDLHSAALQCFLGRRREFGDTEHHDQPFVNSAVWGRRGLTAACGLQRRARRSDRRRRDFPADQRRGRSDGVRGPRPKLFRDSQDRG